MRFAIAVLLLLFTGSTYAQTDTGYVSTIKNLDELVFTAERNSNQRFRTPYCVEILKRKQINELNPRTTPEALQVLNGVFLQKTNHGGGSALIRGLTGNQTLILVDGIRLNNSTFRFGPNQYLNTIDVYGVDRIEVAKGTGSVQYGSDALGGVIQVFSKDLQFSKDKDEWRANVHAKYLSKDMDRTLRSEASFSSRKFAIGAGLTLRDFGDVWGGDTTGRQTPSGYQELDFDVKAGFRLGESTQLTLAQQFVRQRNVPVYHRIVLENYYINEMDPQQRMLSYARFHHESQSSWAKRIDINLSWQQNLEVRNSQRNGSSILRSEEDRVNTLGFTFDIHSLISKSWTANSGIEFYQDNVNSARVDVDTATDLSIEKRGLYPDGARYGNYSIYSLHHLEYGKWRFELGGRYNLFSIGLSDSALGKVRVSPSCLVGNIGLLYQLAQQHNLYFNYSTGYRAPNIDDMGTLGIVDFRYEVPANDLLPEKSRNFELGYKFRSDKFSGSASLYYMRLEDIITRIKVDSQQISGYPVYKKENVESASVRGAEAEVVFRPNKVWTLGSAISYTYGQNHTKNEPLRRIPPLNGRTFLGFRKNNLFIQGEFLIASNQDRLAQGDKDDNRIPKGGTPGWKILNIYSGYEWGALRFNLGLLNLFNEDYRTHGSGINGYGRSAWISITVSI